MSIEILSSQIANQIAAGEVVERPASVVKELVENSIDSGATDIVVRIRDGGRSFISVQDNGSGMSREDAQKSFLRHATSKIHRIEDLFSLHSFGFRGEALAAISSVSRLTIQTKREEDAVGTEVFLEDGALQSVSDIPFNGGTLIAVKDLFYTTPVRLEYMKSDETEYRHILKEIIHFSLSYPGISFQFWKDDVSVLDFIAVESSLNRIRDVLPKFQADLIPLKGSDAHTHISGFICAPGKGTRTKSHQYIFVNGRHIEDYKLSFAIREGYIQSCGMEKHLHPVFVLFIETNPLFVDVNVHPRKREVKFSEPNDLFQLVKNSVIQSLKNNHSQTLSIENNPLPFSAPKLETSSNQSHFAIPSFSERNQYRSYHVHDATSLPSFESENTKSNETDSLSESIQSSSFSFLKAIGQVANKYIIAESDSGIFLFDQHALHERERFEVLWKDYKSQEFMVQKLLTPQSFSFSESDISRFQEYASVFEDLEFEIKIKKNEVVVLALPVLLIQKDIQALLEDILQYAENHTLAEDVRDQCMRKLLEYKSCRGAIMYGDPIHIDEAQHLLDDFLRTQWSELCPHGRPNHVFYSFEDLDRQFHR